MPAKPANEAATEATDGATDGATVALLPTPARDLLAQVAAKQTVEPRLRSGRELFQRLKARLAHPSMDAANNEKACAALLYDVRTECLKRFNIRDFPPDPDKLPPLSDCLPLYQQIDAFLSASQTDEPTQTENR